MLEKILKSTNKPNIIVYGNNNGNVINTIEDVFNLKLKQRFKNHNLKYINVKNIFVFSMFDIVQNYETFYNLISEICKTQTFFSNERKLILFTNYDKIKDNIQYILRVFIEKCSKLCSFIFLTKKINHIIQPIQSRCLLLRSTYKINNFQQNEGILIKHPLKIFLSSIFDVYNCDFSPKTVEKIKNLVKKLLLLHFDKYYFNIYLIEMICSLSVSNKIKYEIINFASKYDALSEKSYREIIYYELLFINIHQKINGLL